MLKGVQEGKRYTITNGRVPVADLVPHADTVDGVVLLYHGSAPSTKLRKLANQRLTRMRRQQRRLDFDLERFIDETREG